MHGTTETPKKLPHTSRTSQSSTSSPSLSTHHYLILIYPFLKLNPTFLKFKDPHILYEAPLTPQNQSSSLPPSFPLILNKILTFTSHLLKGQHQTSKLAISLQHNKIKEQKHNQSWASEKTHSWEEELEQGHLQGQISHPKRLQQQWQQNQNQNQTPEKNKMAIPLKL